MLCNRTNTWKQIYKKGYWVYVLLGLVIGTSYLPVKTLMVTQEPTIWVTKSNLLVNTVILFALWGASCPVIAKRLKKPRWFGYVIMAPILLILVYFMTLFGLETRW